MQNLEALGLVVCFKFVLALGQQNPHQMLFIQPFINQTVVLTKTMFGNKEILVTSIVFSLFYNLIRELNPFPNDPF